MRKINKISEKNDPRDDFAWDLRQNWDDVSGISRKKQWNKIAEYMVEISVSGKSTKINDEEDVLWSAQLIIKARSKKQITINLNCKPLLLKIVVMEALIGR